MENRSEIKDLHIEQEIARMDYQSNISMAAERIRYQHEMGMSAIKALTLANGGAILSLLTFVGNQDAHFDKGLLHDAFLSFGIGLALAIGSYLPAYLSQGWFSNHETSAAWDSQRELQRQPKVFGEIATREAKVGWWLISIAITCVVFSIFLFTFGAITALNGIL